MKQKSNLFKLRFLSVFVLMAFFSMPLSLTIYAKGGGNPPATLETCIVFIDKSGSVNSDSPVLQMYRERLASILSRNVTKRGDVVVVSFIYEQTDNKANQYVFPYDPPQSRDKKMSSNAKRMEQIRYNQRLRAYKKTFAETVMEKAFAVAPSRTQTDIVGSISKLVDLTASGSNRNYRAYYFSDMVESSAFRSMSFSSSGGMQSLADAEQLAKSDFSKILQRYNLKQNCLSQISEICVFFPAVEMDMNRAFSIVPGYWDYIFHQFGVKTINYY